MTTCALALSGADCLRLIIGGAACLIGLAMASAAVLDPPEAARAVPNASVVLAPTEIARTVARNRLVHDGHTAATIRPRAEALDSIPGTVMRTQRSASWNGQGRDPRQFLVAMAMLQRRAPVERPAGHSSTAEGDAPRRARAGSPDTLQIAIPPARPPVSGADTLP